MTKNNKYYLTALKWFREKINPYQSVVVISVMIGLLSGFAAIVLKSLVHYIEAYGVGFIPAYQLFLTPVTGILIVVFLHQYVLKRAAGFHGVGDIIYSILRKSAIIDFILTYSKLITSAITIGFGGSAGLESPIVVTGSAIGSNIGRLFRYDVNYKTLFIGCGSAAGIAAIFNAPIAGVVFSMEVLMPRFTATYFIPVLLASASGALLAGIFSPESIFSIDDILLDYSLNQVPFIILLGIAGGFISLYFTKISWAIKTLFSKIKSVYARALIGGILLGAMVFLFPRLYGEGYIGIRQLFINEGAVLLPPFLTNLGIDPSWVLPFVFSALMLLKPIAANITIHSGGDGGNFAPSFITGGYLGYLFYLLSEMLFPQLDLSAPVFILLGMSSVLSGVMHAPLTGIFLVAEITGGYGLLIPLMLVSAISFFTKFRIEKQPIHFHKGESNYSQQKHELASLDSIELLRLADHDYHVFHPEDTLKEMTAVISASKRNFFPVVDQEENLLGVITLDDFRRVMFDTQQYDILKAKDLMHMPTVYLEWNERVLSALEKFDNSNYWNLPVLRHGKFAGFISKSTILERLRKEMDKGGDIF